MVEKPFVLFIDFYRLCISPLLPNACRFYPSCSAYARESLIRYGLFRGAYLTLIRILKCHPFHPGGFDPVPIVHHQEKCHHGK